jgi:hypothetical protein
MHTDRHIHFLNVTDTIYILTLKMSAKCFPKDCDEQVVLKYTVASKRVQQTCVCASQEQWCNLFAHGTRTLRI